MSKHRARRWRPLIGTVVNPELREIIVRRYGWPDFGGAYYGFLLCVGEQHEARAFKRPILRLFEQREAAELLACVRGTP